MSDAESPGGTPTVLPAGRGASPGGIDAWIAYKCENEADHVRLHPVPAALQL
jgi:hypothetical protein